MRLVKVSRSGKLHPAGLLWLLQVFSAEAGFSRTEALPHCLLQRSQQTVRRVDSRVEAARIGGEHANERTLKAETSLLEVQATSDAASRRESRRKLDPDFFASFTDAESTFDADGRPRFEEAANPRAVSDESESIPTIEPPQWFQESPSAGPKQAWQTYDPETEDVSWRAKAPDWQLRGFGRLQQDWAPVESREKGNADREDGKEAAWFDTLVDQYDWFGRPRAPTPESPKFYVEWSRVSRTADLSCGPPGCVAETSLKVFENASEMEYKMCQLSVMVHATDFDDQYGREKIEWILINNKEAVRDFAPQAPKGCETNDNMADLHGSDVTEQKLSNLSKSSLLAVASKPDVKTKQTPNKATSQQTDAGESNASHELPKSQSQQTDAGKSNASHDLPKSQSQQTDAGKSNASHELLLYPIIRDLPLEGLIDENGELKISGKISPAVDECPVNGNHLSGMVAVACFARPIVTLPPTTTTTTVTVTTTVTQIFKTSDSQHFSCEEPGCTATTVLVVDDFNLTSRKCKLTVRINETDFDEQDGTTERVEWIKVGGSNITENLKPGKNPCQEAASGKPREYVNFTMIDGKDVADKIADGMLFVSMKISDMVDECSVDGRLLDGQADLSCS
mmetsp:Transcript_22928/g.48022  ORF Transcript_22928/g.48022 Transcript_22928/m.48022 type:complete len:624 (-) Transcript_22928:35-1906(-)